MNIYRVITAVSGIRPTWGTLLIVIFVIMGLFIAFKQGKGGVLRNILSVYISVAIASFLPLAEINLGGIKFDDYPWIKVIILVVLFLGVSFFLARSSLGILDKGRSNLFVNLILAFLGSGLFISTVSILLPGELKSELTGMAQLIFVNEIARLLWALGPIVAFVFLG